jgi:DNA-directed RNA polymerase specialized sigma24 family protein
MASTVASKVPLTVVKQEAFALRRQRERHTPITDDGHLGERPTAREITHDQVALYERLRQGAEALRLLKPQETRGLRLRAEGYSYREICRITGWTYTNVSKYLRGPRSRRIWRLSSQVEDPPGAIR